MTGIMTTAEKFEELLTEFGLGELGASPEKLVDPDRLDRCACTRLVDLRAKKLRKGIGVAEQAYHLWRAQQLGRDIM